MSSPEQTARTASAESQAVTGTVRGQAGEVAGTARDRAGDVTGSARDQAGNVAGEVSRQARDLANEARDQVRGQTAQQQRRAAEGVRGLGRGLSDMAEGNGQPSGLAQEIARQAGSRLEAFAGQLENRQPAELLEEIRAFARRRPSAFLAGAAAAGFALGRLVKGGVSAHEDDSGSGGGQPRAGGASTHSSGAVADEPYPAGYGPAVDPYGTGEPFLDPAPVVPTVPTGLTAPSGAVPTTPPPPPPPAVAVPDAYGSLRYAEGQTSQQAQEYQEQEHQEQDYPAPEYGAREYGAPDAGPAVDDPYAPHDPDDPYDPVVEPRSGVPSRDPRDV